MKTLTARFCRSLAASLALVASWVAAVSVSAQPNSTRPLSPDRVTFYSEPNFKGHALTVEAGANVPNLATMQREGAAAWAHAISSVQIEGAAKAVVYSGASFQGDRMELIQSTPDLYDQRRGAGATWDRSIASVSVVGPARTVTPARVVTAPTHSPIPPLPEPPPPRTIIVMPASPPPPPVRVQPRISVYEADAMVRRAYREVLARNVDPEGLRLYRERILRDGWTEGHIIADLQRSHEARNVSADAAITRIYREVLGRDPDPSGLNTYRQRWREGWTQGQIRDDLRRSAENRNGRAREIITRAYRELLGREPDPGGYASYERLIRERGYGERQIREAIMSSDEYRQRRR